VKTVPTTELACLQAQGYEVSDSIVYQDNQSAILLEENGKASSGRRTRHINIRYFFVKDWIDSGEMRVAYCPTGDMIADFLPNPCREGLLYAFKILSSILIQ